MYDTAWEAEGRGFFASKAASRLRAPFTAQNSTHTPPLFKEEVSRSDGGVFKKKRQAQTLGFTGDMQDVRNAIIDILSSGNPRSYAKRGLEQRNRESIEQQRAEMEAVAAQLGFDSVDEMAEYESTVVPRIIESYKGFDETEYYNNLAENYEYDTTRESEGTGRGGEVLQGEQSVPASGAPVAGQRNEGGAVSDDVQGGGQDGAPQGNQEVSSSEIPNNQFAPEGNAPGQNGVVDNQGNPVDADGKLIIEEVSSIDEITDEDFETPTRSVQLPTIPENVATAIGTQGRPVVIKKNVFEKNGNTHVELEPEDSRNILRSALYNPNLVGSTQPIKRPDYKVAIRTGEQNAVVVLDVYQGKDVVEIVGWRMVNEKGLAKMQRQAEREGGQFLILSPNDGSAAALSALPLGLSSTGEDRNSVSNSQENTQKSGEKSEKERAESKKEEVAENAEEVFENPGTIDVNGVVPAVGVSVPKVFVKGSTGTEQRAVEMEVEIPEFLITGNNIYAPLAEQYERLTEEQRETLGIDAGVLPTPGKYRVLAYEENAVFIDFNGGAYWIPAFGSAKLIEKNIGNGEYKGIYKEGYRPEVQTVARAESKEQSEIREPRSVREELENGDVRITNYNSRGEVETVATERDGKVVSVDSYDEGVLFEHTEYDAQGKASSVTRYDKQGNVVGTQKYVNGIESKAYVRETMRTAPLRARAEKWMKDTGVPVRLIGIGDEITNSAARRAINAGEKVTGWIDNNEVVIYLPNIKDAKEIDNTFVHEVVAHKGLKALMGKDFDALCDKVWEMMSEEQRAKYIDYPGVNGDTRKAADEYMAHLAEGVDLTDADKTVWQRIVEAVREFLVKHGMKMTDGDIENLIRASYSRLKGESRNEKGEIQFRIAEINERFNNELQQQIDGTLPKGHIYQLGMPSEVLMATGIPELPIQLNSTKLQEKSTNYGHDYNLEEIKDLVMALHNPLAVFAYGDKTKAQNIVVEIQSNDKNFVIGLALRPKVGGRVLEINSIRNVFPKDNAEWLNWISQGKALYLDKERIQTLIDQQRTNLADVDYLDLNSIANVINNFENPSTESENTLFRTTYHGSGAKFDRFDHSFMGTGEGAQAFGWGTYVTEVEGIGKQYAEVGNTKLSPLKAKIGNIENALRFLDLDVEKAERELEQTNNETAKKRAKYTIENAANRRKALYEEKDAVEKEMGRFARNLYTVEVPDDNGSNYLHWEEVVPKKVETAVKERLLERLSEGQGEAYKSDLKQELNDTFRFSDYTGRSLYNNISAYVGGDKQASLFLSDMGFVGISYPANATTGGRADGARNYVIFNENDAQIENRTQFRIADDAQNRKDSERRKEKNRINNIIDSAAGIIYGNKEYAKKQRLKREAERKQLAKEMYSAVLKGDFNDVTLAQIDKFIEDATPANPFGRRISQRLPQRMERSLRARERTNAVDALFSRISESAVPANERFSEAGRREIEERKKELLKGWAIATGNWHTDLKEFTDDTEPIGEGQDSKVYSAKEGPYVIKASKGKPYGKRFRPDIDNIALFNDVFRNSRYEILGYGENDGEFVRILKQRAVDFSNSVPLTSEERREYMQSLGFEPLNEANTAFSNGEIVIADLQKSNIVKDAEGNIRVIDADAKLHTKDVGGDYTYPPVESDLPEGTVFDESENSSANPQESESGVRFRVDWTDLEPTDESVTFDNFFERTSAVFEQLKQRPDKNPDYWSPSGSMYWYGEDEGGKYVIRESDHWSANISNEMEREKFNQDPDRSRAIASCRWALNLKPKFYGEIKREDVRLINHNPLWERLDIHFKNGRSTNRTGILRHDIKPFQDLMRNHKVAEAYDYAVDLVNEVYNMRTSGKRIGKAYLSDFTKWDKEENTLDPKQMVRELVQPYAKELREEKERAQATEDSGTRFRFIGEKGAANLDNAEEATTRLDNLAVAREMETAGKEAKVIKLATGWERAADGKWRYETEDALIKETPMQKVARLKEEYQPIDKEFDRLNQATAAPLRRGASEEDKARRKELNKRRAKVAKEWSKKRGEIWDAEQTVRGLTVAELIGEDNELLKAYPELADMQVSFVNNTDFIERGYGGFYDGSSIWINPNAKDVQSTFVHEIQHAIQEIEGFARGSNVERFADVRGAVLDSLNFMTNGDLLKGSAISDVQSLRDALDKNIPYTEVSVKEGYAENLQKVARKYGYENIDALVEDFTNMPSAFEQYRRTAGEVESRNVQERMNMTPEERRNSLAAETEDIAREDQIFIYDALESAMAADDLFVKMNENAELLVPRLLTEEIWENEIRGKKFKTPIGDVKLGENQYEKNKGKGREREFGMIIPTLERPDFIFEEVSPEEGAERQTKYVFAKAFYDNEGNKHVYYADVSVLKDGMEAVTSSHHLRDKQVLNKIRKEQMLWNRFASDSMSSAQGGSTDQSNAPSADKGSNNSSNSQGSGTFFRTAEEVVEGDTRFSVRDNLTPEQRKKQEALKENASKIRRLHNVASNFSITALRNLGFALETQEQREEHDRLFAERDAMSGRPSVSIEQNPESMTLMERITEGLMRLAKENEDNVETRLAAIRAYSRELGNALKLMRAQKGYDRRTVGMFVNLVKMYMRNHAVKGMSGYDITRLLGLISRANGGYGMQVYRAAEQIAEIITKSHANELEEMVRKQVRTGREKVNASGVVVQGGVDIIGKRVLNTFKDAIEITDTEAFNKSFADSRNSEKIKVIELRAA